MDKVSYLMPIDKLLSSNNLDLLKRDLKIRENVIGYHIIHHYPNECKCNNCLTLKEECRCLVWK